MKNSFNETVSVIGKWNKLVSGLGCIHAEFIRHCHDTCARSAKKFWKKYLQIYSWQKLEINANWPSESEAVVRIESYRRS